MNILYTNFHPRNGGGHATYIVNLVAALSKNHNITVATPATSRLFNQAGKITGVTCVDTIFSTRAGAMLAEVKKLRHLIKFGKFDLIHVNGSADHRQVMLATKFLKNRPKIIWTKHNTAPINSFGNWLRANFGCDAAIGVSDFVSNILRGSAFRKLPIKTIYHGIDTDKFNNSHSKEQKTQLRSEFFASLDKEVIVLASVGGSDRDKGWLLLAQAISNLNPTAQRKFRLLIAGDKIKGRLLEDFNSLRIDDLVVFPGLVDDPERVLAAADIGFVLSYHEAFSFAAAESMATGLPTLVSTAGGLPEVVQNGVDGWVVPKENISAVQAWLQDILDHGYDLEMSSKARKNAVEKFSMSIFVQNTTNFYQQILASNY